MGMYNFFYKYKLGLPHSSPPVNEREREREKERVEERRGEEEKG